MVRHILLHNTNDIIYTKPNEGDKLIKWNEPASAAASEKSYLPQMTYDETLDLFMGLNCNIKWIFYNLAAVSLLHFFLTYEMFFDAQVMHEEVLAVVKIFCNVVLILDTFSAIGHYSSRKSKKRKIIMAAPSRWLIATQSISLCLLPLQLVEIFYESEVIDYIVLFAFILRYHKIIIYEELLLRIPGAMCRWHFYRKSIIIGYVVLQTAICVWMSIGCLGTPSECASLKKGKNTYWNAGVHAELLEMGKKKRNESWSTHYRRPTSAVENYILCVYYVTGALTSVGYGGPSLKNNIEEVICIVLMFIYIIFIYGHANAQLCRIYVGKQNLGFDRMERRRAMVQDFETRNKLRLRLKTRILKYYDEFWENDFGVKYAPLMNVIPHSLFIDTKTERFWTFLSKCNFLQNTSEAFRRAIACKMYAEVLNKGDVLFEVDTLPEKVCYIARGNVEVLSAVDLASPILALGRGTCLGKTNLLWSSPTRLKVVVASYTVVYILKKADFWKLAAVYHKLKEASAIHKNFGDMLKHTRQHLRKRKVKEQIFRKWKCVESKNILTEFKQKIMNYRRSDTLGVHAHEHPKRHYMYSKIHSQKTYDDIFVKITFPWALQHKSQFLDMWNIALIFLIMYVSIYYPYVAAFTPERPIHSLNTVTAFYIFDVLLCVFTSVDTKTDTIRKVKDIIFSRLEKYTFLLDLVAACPMHWFFPLDGTHGYMKVACIANLNKLAKLYKVNVVVNMYERESKVSDVIIKGIKYACYVTYAAYIMGCVFYMITCFSTTDCAENSWIQAFYRALLELSIIGDQIPDPRETPFIFSFLSMLTVLSGTCSFLSVNMLELCIVIAVAGIGLVALCHLFAGYSCTFTLQNRSAVRYLEFMNTVETYMNDAKIDRCVKTRVRIFLENNWRNNRAVSRRDLYIDCPEHLYNMNQIAQYKSYLRHLELLRYGSSEMVDLAASRCSQLLMPPSAYLIYSGQQCLNIYIILKGFCEIVEGNVTKKALLPGHCINAMEVITGYPSLVTIRAVTHCLVLKLAVADVHYIMRKYPIQVESGPTDYLDEIAVKRVFTSLKTSYLGEISTRPEGEISFFRFPKLRREPLFADFQRGYQRSRLKLFRYFLMRKTILPYGKFLRRWAIAKAVAATLNSIFVPTRFIHYHHFPQIDYLLWVLYVFAIIDIYVRLHVCYYNRRGLLVTHPVRTSYHYFTTSFVLDFLSMIPLGWSAQAIVSIHHQTVVHVLNYNVALQMYRVPDIFRNRRYGIYERQTTWFQFVKYTPFVIVITCLMSCILLFISCEDEAMNISNTLVIGKFSWLTTARDMKYVDINNTYNVFLISCYFTTITMAGVSFSLFNPCNVPEACYVIACIIIGVIMKLYIVVHIAHDRYSVDHKLTGHRNYISQLMQYMSNLEITKNLQTEVIEHVEHIWRRTHGVTTDHLIELLHRPLQMDFVFTLYRRTLASVPIFDHAGLTFYRLLGIEVTEVHFVDGGVVVNLNDLVSKVYIIHKGKAVAYGPDGSVYCTLRKGSMFGNIDNVGISRSMIRVVAKSSMCLLAVQSQTMYNILLKFEHVYNRLQHYILLENLSYIQSSVKSFYIEEHETTRKQLALQKATKRILKASYLIPFQVVLIHFLPCTLSSYHMAYDTHFPYRYILYALDVMHAMNIVYYFFRPYHDHSGELVVDLKRIRIRYSRSMDFFIDMLTVPPYDLLAYCFDDAEALNKIMCGYRIIRIINVYRCYETTTSTSSNKVIIFRMARMITYLMAVVHLCACWFYSFACPLQKCQLGYWVYNRRRYVCDGKGYICSLDIVVSMLSTTGFSLRVPTSINGMLVCICIVMGGTYLQGTVSGDIIALIRNSTYQLQLFNFELTVFMTYLENGYSSTPFITKMREYCVFLWVFGKGRQVPHYVTTLPDYLNEKIKTEAFGVHIYNNVMFENCHRDFLRMLIKKLKMLHFLPNDIICHQEDINNSMFFIHYGGVNVYSVSSNEEIHVDELKKFDCFGLIQGLYPNTPHTHTYKANAITCMLTLQYEDWSTLLRFFPASKFEIYSSMTLLFETVEREERKQAKAKEEKLEAEAREKELEAMDDSNVALPGD